MKKAIIIGAGPAGLTAAYELQKKSDVQPIIIEKDDLMGGISRTVDYKGNMMDMGGHRFFSKDDRVMNMFKKFPGMIERNRKSRIYFERKFFDYPVALSRKTINQLGFVRITKIGITYFKSMIYQKKPEKNLEEFFINKFGKELYKTFFKDYTEKVWGVPCTEISAEWGEQRVRGLSLLEALKHFLKKKDDHIDQKQVKTTLIGKFIYPKYGPGQYWDDMADKIKAKGGKIVKGNVNKIHIKDNKIIFVEANGKKYEGDYFISTMPVTELLDSFDIQVPEEVMQVKKGLSFRDFIIVGLLLTRLKIKSDDNWIYLQEPDIKAGRLQLFNNWSPYMVKDKSKLWVGVEYCCFETDKIWTQPDKEIIDLAKEELHKIEIINKADVLDGTVVRIPKAYPSYTGTYNQFNIIRNYLDQFENLFLIGRNGMHRYNNMDHSMLTGMVAANNIAKGIKDKSNIWDVNTEKEYHEVRESPESDTLPSD